MYVCRTIIRIASMRHPRASMKRKSRRLRKGKRRGKQREEERKREKGSIPAKVARPRRYVILCRGKLYQYPRSMRIHFLRSATKCRNSSAGPASNNRNAVKVRHTWWPLFPNNEQVYISRNDLSRDNHSSSFKSGWARDPYRRRQFVLSSLNFTLGTIKRILEWMPNSGKASSFRRE